MTEDGKIKTVYFSREDDYDCVNKKIKTAFGIAKYRVLECDKKSRLSFSQLESLNGHEAIKRRRALYLCEVSYSYNIIMKIYSIMCIIYVEA